MNQQNGSATATELAQLYLVLSHRDPPFDAAAPAVVLAGVSVDVPTVERLHRFGVDVVTVTEPAAVAAVRPGAYLLGGARHGTWVPGDLPTFGAQVTALVERARLHDWAAEIGPEPRFSVLHTPGSDSRGVVQFRLDGAEVVAKIGAADAITDEARFAAGVNAHLAKEGRRGLFPQVYGVRVEGDQAVSLMEAGTPMPIGPLFADAARTTFAEESLGRLRPHLDQLASWYRLTADTRRPTVADYLYRERYHVLREHPAVVATFGALFDGLALDDLLDARVELPGGLVLPAYTESVAWLDRIVADLLPNHGSAVHGDIYAANMLLRADGSPLLIDPRTVWDGRDRPDIGYGDPVYDLATLLHGVLPMAAILHAVSAGTADHLLDGRARPAHGRLGLTSLRLPVEFPPAVRILEAEMLRAVLRADEPRWHARTRLYVGAATSLAGWLKYEGSLRTAPAWLATFTFVLWYLWQARQVWEGAHSDRERDS